MKKKRTAPLPDLRFTADQIVLRAIDELKPFPNNPKIHTAEQVDAIAANMLEFGFDQPILIDEDDVILKGHGRQLGARKAAIALVPTILRKGLTFAQKWAIVISDNALPAMTGFDQSLLRVGLTYLAKADYPLTLTGFDQVRLATFIGGTAGSAPPNDVPDLAPAISKPGDVWMMGPHRLVCGDSSSSKTVTKLFADGTPKVMLTDPPYRAETRGGGIYSDMTHTAKMKRDAVDGFEVSQLAELLQTNIIFTSKDLLADYLDLVRERGLKWDVAVLHRAAAVPNHNNHLMSDLDYIVLAGKIAPKPGLEHTDYSKLFSTGHWERPVPWAKPVELITRILRLYTAAGDLVFEPYCGSGTTVIAAETLGRVCLAIELNAAYVDLTVRRWEKFANKTATLQGTKKTFEQVERERGAKRAA
jgi:hypothetical protein